MNLGWTEIGVIAAIISAIAAVVTLFKKKEPVQVVIDEQPAEEPEPGHLSHLSRLPPKPVRPMIGRQKTLSKIADTLADKKIVVLRGISGIGKTTLALEFAYRHGPNYPGGVFWMSCSSPESLVDEVAACGAFLKISGQPDEIARFTKQEWQKAVPRLLIFDDCANESIIRDWAPDIGGCRVLATSTAQDWKDREDQQIFPPLRPLSQVESREMLTQFRPISDDEEVPILNDINGSPFLLNLVGNYLVNHPSVSIDTYREEVLANHEDHATGVFLQSFDQLEPENAVDQLALDILAITTWLEPGLAIRNTFFNDLGKRQEVGNLDEAITRLLRLGLLEGDDRYVQLHPLSVRHLVEAIGEQEINQALKDVLARLEDQHYSDAHKESQKRWCARQLWHIASQLQEQDRLPESDRTYQKAIEIWDQGLDPQSQTLATRLNFLGEFYMKRRTKYDDLIFAINLFKRAVDIGDQSLGETHHKVIDWVENLADALLQHGDFRESEDYFRRLIEYSEKHHASHITAKHMMNLGCALAYQDEYSEARSLFEESLTIMRDNFGEKHLETARFMHNLGSLYRTMGVFSTARSLLEETLDIYRRIYKSYHPSIAQVLDDLGAVHLENHDLTTARTFFEEALNIRLIALGDHDAETAISYFHLGHALYDLGDLNTARHHFEQALEIRQSILGPKHPDTTTSLGMLGRLHKSAGDLATARSYITKALEIVREVLGPRHTFKAHRMGDYASLLAAEGSLKSAKSAFEQALAIFMERLGNKHPNTLRIMEELNKLEQRIKSEK